MYLLRIFTLATVMVCAQPSYTAFNSNVTSKFLKTTLGLAAASAGYYWWRTPLKITPNLSNLNILTFSPTTKPLGEKRTIEAICTALQQKRNDENHQQHIEINGNTYNTSRDLPATEKKVLIYVSGYAGMSGNARYKYIGSGAYAFSKYASGGSLKDVICVTFDGQVNDRRTFNFGQKLDQDCLQVVLTETNKRNPDAKIILFGSCKGAVVIQNFISDPINKTLVQPVCDVILESPSLSLDHLAKHVAQNHVPKLLQPLVPLIFRATFPNYKPISKTLVDTAENIPDHIRVHIAALPHDKTASYSDIRAITKRLEQIGKHVNLFEWHDKKIPHAKLFTVDAFQQWISTVIRN